MQKKISDFIIVCGYIYIATKRDELIGHCLDMLSSLPYIKNV